MDRRRERLRALLDPLHREVQPSRDREAERLLGVDVELRAEAAADVRGDHAQPRLRNADDPRERQPRDVRDLRRGPQRQLTGTRQLLGEGAARLHRHRDQPLLAVLPLDRDVGLGERLVDLAGVELPDVALVRPEVVVHERCVGVERLGDIRDHLERLVLDLDELGRVLRDRPRLRHDDCDTVADVPRLVEREREVRRHPDLFGDGPRAGQRAGPVGCELRAAEGGDDALDLPRGGEVDLADPRVRIRAADDGEPDLARKVDVVDELAVAGDELPVLLARDRRADDAAGGERLGGGHHASTPTAAARTAATMFW